MKVDVETPQTEESAADNNDLYEKKIQQVNRYLDSSFNAKVL